MSDVAVNQVSADPASASDAAGEPRPHDWPSLDDAVHHGQRLFRQLLGAMAEPGTFAEIDLAPLPEGVALSSAAWGALLALCDLDSRVWIAEELNRDGLAEAIAFHTGARTVTRAEEADFALLTPQRCQTMPSFAGGSDSYPDRSTTLIVVLESLSEVVDKRCVAGNERWRLSGPGILDSRVLELNVTADALMTRLAANRAGFPLGLDAILTSAERLAAIPRSTRIERLSGATSPDGSATPTEEDA
ncbi:phosphonate C-P lyase system protein PhnH [Vreelandella subglaciescola]|jgi:alpha-D-ribose 1-methylphosphonate 5-triphosphate synthase subunit PhnH|uniref:Alpha-D-ribose 1-methylphosphonate 5-triphosphate synthase subunit PhnH n=1 Tax=Vreelandella subglaciescola TaxID=29571 RepID=A0A1M7GWJ2_9GAMM|nr:phosphonate C-P lyase system protein PhnH [Halomonas subglaciescola]SHM20784.1 alpha-D-ribose 1-methylphosphonate 5-triphosphate synthase subunit PhnH [Halomonas subglaciescola]